jgi:hypothetical protein
VAPDAAVEQANPGDPGDWPVAVPFVAGELPVIEGRVDGHPVRLLIDTGASATIVSARLIGATNASGVRLRELCLGALCLPGRRAWAADTPFSRSEPGAINGIVGIDPLREFIVELDHDRALVLGHTPVRCGRAPEALSFDDDGRPYLPARLDDHILGQVLLDSGSVYTLLTMEAAAEALYLGQRATSTGACSIHGCTDTGSFLSTAQRFCAGQTCLDDVPVKYPAWNAVGFSFLRRLHTILDLEAATVAFCP